MLSSEANKDCSKSRRAPAISKTRLILSVENGFFLILQPLSLPFSQPLSLPPYLRPSLPSSKCSFAFSSFRGTPRSASARRRTELQACCPTVRPQSQVKRPPRRQRCRARASCRCAPGPCIYRRLAGKGNCFALGIVLYKFVSTVDRENTRFVYQHTSVVVAS